MYDFLSCHLFTIMRLMTRIVSWCVSFRTRIHGIQWPYYNSNERCNTFYTVCYNCSDTWLDRHDKFRDCGLYLCGTSRLLFPLLDVYSKSPNLWINKVFSLDETFHDVEVRTEGMRRTSLSSDQKEWVMDHGNACESKTDFRKAIEGWNMCDEMRSVWCLKAKFISLEKRRTYKEIENFPPAIHFIDSHMPWDSQKKQAVSRSINFQHLLLTPAHEAASTAKPRIRRRAKVRRKTLTKKCCAAKLAPHSSVFAVSCKWNSPPHPLHSPSSLALVFTFLVCHT